MTGRLEIVKVGKSRSRAERSRLAKRLGLDGELKANA
jgi:hypothetical protein